MKTASRIFLVAGLLLPVAIRGEEKTQTHVYYVDSQSGKDASSGSSPSFAWASLKRVSDADLQPGDTVRFKSGSTWRGTLAPVSGEEGKPVTYTTYGEGVKPLLLGSASRSDPSDWVETTDNVWATIPPEWIPRQQILDLRRSTWSLHQEAGAKVAVKTKESESGRTLAIECQSSGSRSNHIQIWGPNVDWEKAGDAEFLLLHFRARCNKPFRMGSIGVRKSDSPWTAFTEGCTTAPQIGTEWGEHEVALQIRYRKVSAALHLNLGGFLPDDSVFEFEPSELMAADCTQKHKLAVDVGNIIFDQGKQCGWKRWTLESVKRPADYFYDADGMRVFLYSEGNPAEAHDSIELALKRHIINQGSKHDIIYDGLDLRYGAAHGFGGGSTARLIIRNCDLSFIGGGHQHTNDSGKPVRFGNGIEFWGACRDHLVEGCRIWEVYDAALTNQGRGPSSVQENITYRNNIIRNCEYSFEYWNGPETARTRNIRFVNNTCIDAGVVWSHAQRPDPNGSHLMFYSNDADSEGIEVRYNIFYNSTEWGSRYSSGWKPLPDIDYNVWYVPKGELSYFFREHIPCDDVRGYREKTGLDAHSFFGDPKLVEPKDGDYRLVPDSPVKNLHPDGGSIGAFF